MPGYAGPPPSDNMSRDANPFAGVCGALVEYCSPLGDSSVSGGQVVEGCGSGSLGEDCSIACVTDSAVFETLVCSLSISNQEALDKAFSLSSEENNTTSSALDQIAASAWEEGAGVWLPLGGLNERAAAVFPLMSRRGNVPFPCHAPQAMIIPKLCTSSLRLWRDPVSWWLW